jgi:hypothetical protein
MSDRAQVKVVKEAERQHVVSQECKCATISTEQRARELEKIRLELLTLAQRVNKLLAA